MSALAGLLGGCVSVQALQAGFLAHAAQHLSGVLSAIVFRFWPCEPKHKPAETLQLPPLDASASDAADEALHLAQPLVGPFGAQ